MQQPPSETCLTAETSAALTNRTHEASSPDRRPPLPPEDVRSPSTPSPTVPFTASHLCLATLRSLFSAVVQVGIVGLPNVGKSTLFNTITKMGIPAENFPFCTIEPNHVRSLWLTGSTQYTPTTHHVFRHCSMQGAQPHH